MGELKWVSKESKMFRNKISTIPMIIIIVCFGSLTLSSCTAFNEDALKKRTPSPVQNVVRTESPSPSQPPVSESALHNKIDLSEKGGTVRPLSPENDPPPVNPADSLKRNDGLIKSPGPAGAPPQILSSELPEKSGTVKNNPIQNPLKLNPREARSVREEETERDIMEEALLLLDESQKYWVNGELEDAIQMLDQAYALLLDTNGNPDIARQKDDLRLMISKRILAIYNSLQSVAKGKRGEIPIITNADVE